MTHIILLLSALARPPHLLTSVLTESMSTCYVRAADAERAVRARLAERAQAACGERGVHALHIVAIELDYELRAAGAVQCGGGR